MKLRTVILSLRSLRKYHRILGIFLGIFLFVSAVTGFLLGWKKDIHLLQPPTLKGQTKNLSDWKPIDELAKKAENYLQENLPSTSNTEIDRIDIRPDKGIAKVLFKNGWWEIQIDGASGQILSLKRRHSDWIEQLHDGSIISDNSKLISMNILGIGLIGMILTGLWLWYGPKQYRKIQRRK